MLNPVVERVVKTVRVEKAKEFASRNVKYLLDDGAALKQSGLELESLAPGDAYLIKAGIRQFLNQGRTSVEVTP